VKIIHFLDAVVSDFMVINFLSERMVIAFARG